MPYIPYLPYIPNIPYFPNMPYQTDHTHHTYPTYHTTPPPHHRGGGGQCHTPTTPQGGEGEDLIWGQYMGPIPWGWGGGGGGRAWCIYTHINTIKHKHIWLYMGHFPVSGAGASNRPWWRVPRHVLHSPREFKVKGPRGKQSWVPLPSLGRYEVVVKFWWRVNSGEEKRHKETIEKTRE